MTATDNPRTESTPLGEAGIVAAMFPQQEIRLSVEFFCDFYGAQCGHFINPHSAGTAVVVNLLLTVKLLRAKAVS